MKKVFYIFLGIIISTAASNAQSSSVYGKVTDAETGEEFIYANIVLNKNGVFVTGGSTDFEGNYSIPLDPGTYELKISYTGYPDRTINDVIIKGGQGTKLDIAMEQGIEMITYVGCYFDWGNPLIDQENTSSGKTITSEEIRNKPNKDIPQLIQSTPGVSISNF